jgi:hypothetical protein
VLFVHPGDRVDVQAGFTLAGVAVVPRPFRQPARVMTGPEYEDVALAQLNSLGTFGRFELGTGYNVTWLQPSRRRAAAECRGARLSPRCRWRSWR